MKRFLFIALVAAGFLVHAYAGDLSMNVLGAYYIPNHAGYEASGFAPVTYTPMDGQDAPGALRTLGSTWGAAEAKVALSYTHTF